MAHSKTAAERVRSRLIEWAKSEGHGSRKRLADAVHAKYGEKMSASWATGVTKDGKTELRLRYLDVVSDLLGVPPGDLVKRDGDHYMEVTPSEMRLIRYFRILPDVIRGHWMAYLDYLFSFQERSLGEQASERDRRTAAARAEHDERREA